MRDTARHTDKTHDCTVSTSVSAALREIPNLERLIPALRAGHEEAFAQLVSYLWKPAIFYACGLLGSCCEAEDAVQETFMDVSSNRAGILRNADTFTALFRV